MAGDSAGASLCLALLQICRDQGLPMPAGASLISPWVDLVHCFPSITEPTDYDYVPSTGFHAKHSLSWPPPPSHEMAALGIPRNPNMSPDYEIEMSRQLFTSTEQINMYAQNLELIYPLVSPIYAATLGGLCPCQVIGGGGEILRDEQIYLAHKMANPAAYPLSDAVVRMNGENPIDTTKFPPTDVQLLVFDDGAHAMPTLGYVDIAKFQYRATARFFAWALARAQNTEIEIEDFVGDYTTKPRKRTTGGSLVKPTASRDRSLLPQHVKHGPLRAGHPLPPFEEHMNRFRVTRQGVLYPMEPPASMPALNIPTDQIGLPKGHALEGWMQYKQKLDQKFASDKRKGG